MPVDTLLQVGAIVFGGGVIAAIITAVAARPTVIAEAGHMSGETWADTLEGQRSAFEARFAVMESTIREQAARLSAMEAELHLLRNENASLRVLEMRTQTPVEALPMSEFSAAGWLDGLNELVAWPLGVHVRIYTDLVDERWALGYEVVPLSEVPVQHLLATRSAKVAARALAAHHVLSDR